MKQKRAARSTLTALLGLGALAGGGCQTPKPEPTAAERLAGSQSIVVQPAWNAFAEDNFRGMVVAGLRGETDIRFSSDPNISASRDLSTGAIELMTLGDVDVASVTGASIRKPYVIIWQKHGGSWDPISTSIGAGSLSPDPLHPLPPRDKPITKPKTMPATTPADPGAAPAPAAPAAPTPPPQ